MARSISLAVPADQVQLGAIQEQPKPVFLYAGGQRTDQQETTDVGDPVYRATGIAVVNGEALGEVTIRTTSATIPAVSPFSPLAVVGTTRITIASQDQYNVRVTVFAEHIVDPSKRNDNK